MGAVTPKRRSEAGLTLTEVAVVMIIGTMIMAALVGFYLASQGLWLDASTQAITQREATLVASAIRDKVRASGFAQAFSGPDPQHQQLALYDKQGDPPSYYFWWDPSDSLIHAGPTIGGANSGPMVTSVAERFQVTASTSTRAVRVDLRLRSATGNTVEVGTLAVFMN